MLWGLKQNGPGMLHLKIMRTTNLLKHKIGLGLCFSLFLVEPYESFEA